MADELRPDIQQARDRMSYRLGSNREIRKLLEYLWHGEQVTHLVGGTYGSGTGLVVLTDRRLMFLKDGWTSQTTENFPFEKISSVQWSGGMRLGKILVFASGNKAEIQQVRKADGKAVVDALNNIIVGGPPQPQQAPAPVAQQAPPQQQAPAPIAQQAPPQQPVPAPHSQQAPSPAGFQQFPSQPQPPADPLGQVPSYELVRALRDRGVVSPDEFAFLVQRL